MVSFCGCLEETSLLEGVLAQLSLPRCTMTPAASTCSGESFRWGNTVKLLEFQVKTVVNNSNDVKLQLQTKESQMGETRRRTGSEVGLGCKQKVGRKILQSVSQSSCLLVNQSHSLAS